MIIPGVSSEPRMTARFERKREAILDAAARLFNARGVRGTTLADVAAAVGLGTASITYYYPRRDALAAACFRRSIEAAEALVAAAARQPDPPRRVRALVAGCLGLYRDILLHEHSPLVSFADIRAVAPPDRDALFAAYTEMFRGVRRLFGAGGGTGERRARGARAHLLISALLWKEAWVERYEAAALAGVAEALADILENGLAACALPPMRGEAHAPRRAATPVSREAFLRAATALINEEGYRGASVEKIAARLAVTKGSFYHHNATKDALVVACFHRSFALMRLAQHRAEAGGGSGLERLWNAVTILVRHQLEGGAPLLRASALNALPEPLRQQMLHGFERGSLGFARMIRAAIADGSMRAIDAYLAGQLANATINAASELDRWVPGITGDEAVELFVAPLFRGLSVMPG
jgi:AcrR family transcriptional regulator